MTELLLQKKNSSYYYLKSKLSTGLPFFSAVFLVLLIVLLLLHFIWHGAPGITWTFLSEAPRNNNTEGGIFPAIYGTVFLVFIMSLLGVPIGTATAIYLSEYAKQQSFSSRSVRFGVNTLAGVPSIVFGLFGVGFFVQFIGKGIDTAAETTIWSKPSLIWAAATLSVLTLPVVIVAVEEALRNVPQELRAASLALGATKWQTIWRVVLPNSLTGILTGTILAIGRGAGEVAPVIFVGAVYSLPQLPDSLSDQFMHMGYHIYVLATQSPNAAEALPLQYASTLVLLMLAFSLNLTAAYIRLKIRRSHK